MPASSSPRLSRLTTGPDGLLLVDKPAGVSSHDVVAAARRSMGERRIGHTGTLDPFATGLLVLLVGRATRLLRHVPGDPKIYEATVSFGAETDTEDPLGVVVREAALPKRAAVEAAILTLTGELDQVPPAYSAKRIDGRRAYDLARAGRDVTLAPARVRVDRWDVLSWSERGDGVSECAVRITCGGGTYVRSLARDLGRLADGAAHVSSLRRVQNGAFDVRDAVTLEDLRGRRCSIRPPLDALSGLPVQRLSDDEVKAVARGIDIAAAVDGAWGALVDDSTGCLVALGERRDARWQPRVVMREA